jgi:hypothetical protein
MVRHAGLLCRDISSHVLGLTLVQCGEGPVVCNRLHRNIPHSDTGTVSTPGEGPLVCNRLKGNIPGLVIDFGIKWARVLCTSSKPYLYDTRMKTDHA